MMLGRWFEPWAGNGVLVTSQVLPPSVDMDFGINPSMSVFLPPIPRMVSPSLSRTKVVCLPPVRPAVSYQVPPLSLLAQSTDFPPQPSLATYIVPSLSRRTVLIGCFEWQPTSFVKLGNLTSHQVVPLSAEEVHWKGKARPSPNRGLPQKKYIVPLSFQSSGQWSFRSTKSNIRQGISHWSAPKRRRVAISETPASYSL